MPNIMDGSSTLEGPSVAEEASIDSNASIQTNQTISPPSSQQLGFCYSCNRNSLIDTSNFSCASCSSGFVELLVEESANSRNRTPTSPDQESIFDRPFLRLINLGRTESTNRLSNLFTGLNENPTLDPSSATATSTQDSFFSRFRSIRDRGQTGFRFRNQAEADQDDESSRSSSSSSRRRSRSPPILARTSSRPFSRTRFLSLLDDDSNMFIDYGAVVITTLINQLRNRGAAPASESQIQNLPVVLVDQKLVDESSQCAVCMDDFTLNEHVKKLPCKHLFHDSCIATWLKLHATCPVCRNNINGEETTSSTNTSTLLNDHDPAFFNIIPFNSDEAIAISSSTSSGSSSIAQQNLRRNGPSTRNQSLYRIHIRPHLNTRVSQMNEPNNEETESRQRSGIRIRTHLTNDSQSEANETIRRSSRLNIGQMVHQFVGRHPNDDVVPGRDRNIDSSIRVSTRLSQSSHPSQRSRYSNVMNFLINQIQERANTVNRNEENPFLDDDVIEIEQENNQSTDADESNQTPSDDLPNAKRRRV